MVDTGSTEAVIPNAVAEELGLENLGDEIVELANGSTVKATEWGCWIEFEGKKKPQPTQSFDGVIEPLIGVLFLEAFNLEVNSKNEIVKKSTPLKAK